MSQNELDMLQLAGIGEPIPVEGTFTANGKALAKRLNLLQKILEVVSFDVGMHQFIALGIHQTHEHLS